MYSGRLVHECHVVGLALTKLVELLAGLVQCLLLRRSTALGSPLAATIRLMWHHVQDLPAGDIVILHGPVPSVSVLPFATISSPFRL